MNKLVSFIVASMMPLSIGTYAATDYSKSELAMAFNGQVGAGIFYLPTSFSNHRLIVGAGATFPATGQSGYFGLVGLENIIPILGGLDIEGIIYQATASSESVEFGGVNAREYTLAIIKKWLYPITEDVRIGAKVSLLSVTYRESTEQVETSLLDSAWPIVGVTVEF